MRILGIETSCDDTACALVENGRKIVTSVVASQLKWHKVYSGVVPELASRAHVLLINHVVEKAILGRKKIDAIAVTVGPGLVGSLLVGKMTAEALGWCWNIPVIGVDHLEGHLLSPVLADSSIKPPFLGLVVSGGHTDLILAEQWGRYKLLGRTRDDAAGEAFDKVAKMLGLGYPGGPIIDKLARRGNPLKYPMPRAWMQGTWEFSFSGLKTAVLYTLKKLKRVTQKDKRDICAGFQDSVVDVLVSKTIEAVRRLHLKHLVVGGGVAANSKLREKFSDASSQYDLKCHFAPLSLCTDNAVMIASSGYFKWRYGSSHRLPLKVVSSISMPPRRLNPPLFKSLIYR